MFVGCFLLIYVHAGSCRVGSDVETSWALVHLEIVTLCGDVVLECSNCTIRIAIGTEHLRHDLVQWLKLGGIGIRISGVNISAKLSPGAIHSPLTSPSNTLPLLYRLTIRAASI